MIFLFNYLKLSIWSLIYSQSRSDVILKVIKKNIDDSGCVAIKFMQWILPKIEVIYSIDKKEKGNEWFYEFEEFYENCKTHSLKMTEDIYQKEFNHSIYDDFIIDELVASGSIGQVYKVHNKKNEYFALKVIHPNMIHQINFLYFIVRMLYFIPFIRDYINYYLPISLLDFIVDFKLQTNLINEGNNCLRFQKEYENNSCIIIPEVYKVSRNILIMSYEEGTKFDDSDSTDYIKSQVQLLLKLFIKHNQHFFFMHGDLHKGNWKLRENGKIVIYDFGYCWKVPDFLHQSLQKIDKAFMDVDDDKKIVESFTEAIYLFSGRKVDRELIRKEIHILSRDLSCQDTTFLFKLLINCLRKNNIVLDSYVIQSLILHNQMESNLIRYNITIEGTEKPGYISYTYYRKQIHDIICFCETRDIFPEYRKLIEKEYEEEDIVLNELFETSQGYDTIPGLKELAIN